jgi:hypothetical protein
MEKLETGSLEENGPAVLPLATEKPFIERAPVLLNLFQYPATSRRGVEAGP